MNTLPILTTSEYVRGIKEIYNDIKNTALVKEGVVSDDTVSDFCTALNRVAQYSRDEYSNLGALVRFMYRNNKSEFIQFAYRANMLYLSILTDGSFITKVLKIQNLVFIRWDNSKCQFIAIPLSSSNTRPRSRKSQKKRSRANSRRSVRSLKDGQKGEQKGGQANSRKSKQANSRKNSRRSNKSKVGSGGIDGTSNANQWQRAWGSKSHASQSTDVKLGRRSYLSIATGVPATKANKSLRRKVAADTDAVDTDTDAADVVEAGDVVEVVDEANNYADNEETGDEIGNELGDVDAVVDADVNANDSDYFLNYKPSNQSWADMD